MRSDEAVERLKYNEGHIHGIKKMILDDAYRIDIIQQNQAVQAALNNVNGMILEGHLNSCLITAIRGDDPAERVRVLREISGVFNASQKR